MGYVRTNLGDLSDLFTLTPLMVDGYVQQRVTYWRPITTQIDCLFVCQQDPDCGGFIFAAEQEEEELQCNHLVLT